MPINSAQVRMARAALQLGVRELAQRVGVTPGTIVRIEAGKPAFDSTLERLEAVFGEAGVNCFVDESGGCGVTLIAKREGVSKGKRAASKRLHLAKRRR